MRAPQKRAPPAELERQNGEQCSETEHGVESVALRISTDNHAQYHAKGRQRSENGHSGDFFDGDSTALGNSGRGISRKCGLQDSP